MVADTTESKFTTVPDESSLNFDPEAAYVHYTPNETIVGVEFDYIPDTGDVPLVADMSSTILSRHIDVSKFAVIYAGAQKNVGPAGVAVVVIKKEWAEKVCVNKLPKTLDYKMQIKKGSMFNTPPAFNIYVTGKVFKWVLKNGGLKGMEERNKKKAY